MATELKARERTFVADMQRRCEIHEHYVTARYGGDGSEDRTPIFDRRRTRRCFVAPASGSGGGVPLQEEPSDAVSSYENDDDASCGFDPLSPAVFHGRGHIFDLSPAGLGEHPPNSHGTAGRRAETDVTKCRASNGGDYVDGGDAGVRDDPESPLGMDYVTHIEKAEKSFWGTRGYYGRQCLRPGGHLANRKGAPYFSQLHISAPLCLP